MSFQPEYYAVSKLRAACIKGLSNVNVFKDVVFKNKQQQMLVVVFND